jgi:TM2 domain-containing membrane protein YozV
LIIGLERLVVGKIRSGYHQFYLSDGGAQNEI